jgi:hypothetical protein
MRLTARIAPVALVSLLVALLVAGCGTAVPTATPQDMTGVLSALVLRGVAIRQVVGGDTGCPNSPLHSNAARIDLNLEGNGRDQQVYLFRWRRTADYDAAAEGFAECVAQHAARSTPPAVEVVEVRPWRAYGSGWSRELTSLVREALQAAAGN